MAQQQQPNNHNFHHHVKEHVLTFVSSQLNRTVVSLTEAKNLFLGGFDGCGINMNSFNNFRNKLLFFRSSSSSSHRSSSFSLGDEDEEEDDSRLIPLLFDPSQTASASQPSAQFEPSENGSSVYMTPPTTFLFPPRAISFLSKKRVDEEERIQKEELTTFGSGREISFGYQAPLLPSLTPVFFGDQPIKNKKQEDKNHQLLNLINYDADEENAEGGETKKISNTPQILQVLLKEDEEEEEEEEEEENKEEEKEKKKESKIENTNHLEQSNLFLQTPFEQLAQIASSQGIN